MTPSSVFLFRSVWEQGVSLGILRSFQFVLEFQVSSFGWLYLLIISLYFFHLILDLGKKICLTDSFANRSLVHTW